MASKLLQALKLVLLMLKEQALPPGRKVGGTGLASCTASGALLETQALEHVLIVM